MSGGAAAAQKASGAEHERARAHACHEPGTRSLPPYEIEYPGILHDLECTLPAWNHQNVCLRRILEAHRGEDRKAGLRPYRFDTMPYQMTNRIGKTREDLNRASEIQLSYSREQQRDERDKQGHKAIVPESHAERLQHGHPPRCPAELPHPPT